MEPQGKKCLGDSRLPTATRKIMVGGRMGTKNVAPTRSPSQQEMLGKAGQEMGIYRINNAPEGMDWAGQDRGGCVRALADCWAWSMLLSQLW